MKGYDQLMASQFNSDTVQEALDAIAECPDGCETCKAIAHILSASFRVATAAYKQSVAANN